MRKEVIAVIGAGAVGSGLAIAARSSGHTISCVISRRTSSARVLARKVGARSWGSRLDALPADVTLFIIAVPDTEIATVAMRLAETFGSSPGRRRAFHTSGAATSDVLRPIRATGMKICSIHPIRSFPSGKLRTKTKRSMKNEWFGIEGRPDDVRWARTFVRSLGGRSVIVPKSKKTLYHIACTFASNYPMAILRAAESVALASGIRGGLEPLAMLISGSIQNAIDSGPMRSFTGPIARSDGATLKRHRIEIRKKAPHLLALFDELVAFASRESELAGRISSSQGRSVRRAINR